MLRLASPTLIPRGRHGCRRGCGCAAGFMTKSLWGTVPVFLQSCCLGSVARHDGSDGLYHRVTVVSIVEHDLLQFFSSSPAEADAQSVAVLQKVVSGREARWTSWGCRRRPPVPARSALSGCALRELVSQRVDTQARRAGDDVLARSGRAHGTRVRRHGAGVHRSGDGELPWRGRCFEATACRLLVRPSA